MKTRTVVGSVGTGVWISIAIVIAYLKRDSIESMKLNEIGDALAGTIAPVAFFWLIIGYFQQGEELNQNTQALIDQQKETALLVKQTERQAKATEAMMKMNAEKNRREQIEIQKSIRPSLKYTSGSFTDGGCSLKIENDGGAASDLRIETDSEFEMIIEPHEFIDSLSFGRIEVKGKGVKFAKFDFKVYCSNKHGDEVELEYQFKGNKGGFIEKPLLPGVF
jgi:hypothetical protein